MTMQLFFQAINNKIIKLDVLPSETLLDVKLKIQDVEGIFPNRHRLVYDEKQLDDDKTVSYYNIKDEDRIISTFISQGKTISLAYYNQINSASPTSWFGDGALGFSCYSTYYNLYNMNIFGLAILIVTVAPGFRTKGMKYFFADLLTIIINCLLFLLYIFSLLNGPH